MIYNELQGYKLTLKQKQKCKVMFNKTSVQYK
nr:MAG TPA: hypothetical protein [Caudoviricetes sp.]